MTNLAEVLTSTSLSTVRIFLAINVKSALHNATDCSVNRLLHTAVLTTTPSAYNCHTYAAAATHLLCQVTQRWKILGHTPSLMTGNVQSSVSVVVRLGDVTDLGM